MVTPAKTESQDTEEKFTFRQVSDLADIIVWTSHMVVCHQNREHFSFNTEFQLQTDFTVVVYV